MDLNLFSMSFLVFFYWFQCYLNNILIDCLSKGQGYGSVIPDANGAESHLLTKTLAEKVGKYVEQYLEAMEKVTIICLTLLL